MGRKYLNGITNILITFIFFGVVYLAGSYLRIRTDSGAFIPVLSSEYLNGSFFFVVFIIIFTIVRECVKMIAPPKHLLILLTTAVVNICSSVLYVIWLNDKKIKDIQFIEEMTHRFSSHKVVLLFINRGAAIFAFFVVLGLTVDLLCVAAKTRKQRKVI